MPRSSSEFLMHKQWSEPNLYLSHRDPMQFIREVESIDEETVVCLTDTSPNGKLSIALNPDGSLENYFLCEIMAQTIGVWAGAVRAEENLRNAGADPDSQLANIGLLLSIRNAVFETQQIPANTEIRIKMQRLFQDGRVATFEGEALSQEKMLGTARITVYQPTMAEMKRLFVK